MMISCHRRRPRRGTRAKDVGWQDDKDLDQILSVRGGASRRDVNPRAEVATVDVVHDFPAERGFARNALRMPALGVHFLGQQRSAVLFCEG
jgi:hypothetical protein